MGARRKGNHPAGLPERREWGGGLWRGCSPYIYSQSPRAAGTAAAEKPPAAVGTLPAGTVPLAGTVTVVFGKDEGELPPPSPPPPTDGIHNPASRFPPSSAEIHPEGQ